MSGINWFKRAEQADLHVRNFIEGNYVECLGDTCIQKYSPRDGRLLYEFRSGLVSELDRAVASAKQAFDRGKWKNQSVHQRKAVFKNLKILIETNKEKLALFECLDVGKPITCALNDDLSAVLYFLDSYIENMDKLLSPCGFDGSDFAYRLRKPVGVVGGIIGWNYPLMMAVLKMGPALAMGNSLVLKPSEFSSLSTSYLAALAVEAGVPSGVFNVVNGAGSVIGHRLAHHPDIDLLSFTGSSDTGKKMMVAAGQSNMKRLILECGGKSPFIVFEDCPKDLDFVAEAVVDMAFRNQGELCVAGSRLLVQASIRDQLLPKIVEKTTKLKAQDPLDPESVFGPLINETQMNKVLDLIEIGKKEGATLLLGGGRARINGSSTISEGYYVEATIFDQVNPGSRIAQEEIFGPVLSIFTFEDEAEAVILANNSCYGLAAYAATTNLSRAHRLAQKLNVGGLQIIGSSLLTEGAVEIGSEPHKQSGFGSEVGASGLSSYSLCSTIHVLS